MTTIFCMALTAIGVIFYYEVLKPKSAEIHFSLAHCWIDFIKVNIESCKTTDQCLECFNLINSFDKMFRNKMPSENFNHEMEIMWNRLDTRHKALKIEEQTKFRQEEIKYQLVL